MDYGPWSMDFPRKCLLLCLSLPRGLIHLSAFRGNPRNRYWHYSIYLKFVDNLIPIFVSFSQAHVKFTANPPICPSMKITASILWISMASISMLQSFIMVFMAKSMAYALVYLGLQIPLVRGCESKMQSKPLLVFGSDKY